MDANEFKLAFTEFVNVPNGDIDRYLNLFVVLYGVDYHGGENRLQGLYVAHRLTIQNQSQVSPLGLGGTGSVQQIASKKEGDVSVTYGASGVTANARSGDFNLSSYGVDFEYLMFLFSIGGIVSNSRVY